MLPALTRNTRDMLAPGSYHTDGKRLLRITGRLGDGELRTVEDCRTLDVIIVSAKELLTLGLRPVPARGPAATRPAARTFCSP